jgi:Brp/Blh family beta-carotene 15,15'-monooxygenase
MDWVRIPLWAKSLVFPVVASLVAVFLAASPTAIPFVVQITGLAVLVVVLGLPHGALDPWIAELAGLMGTRARRVAFNLSYVVLAAAVTTVWTLAPALTLLMFLVISAWHFSGDWGEGVGRLWRWLTGSLLLLLPIGFHTAEVAEIFELLSGERGAGLALRLSIPGLWLILATAVVSVVSVFRGQWRTSIEFLALLVLAITAPPLVYFALYFCLLHSPRHLFGYFKMAGSTQRVRLIRMTVVYSAGSLLLAVPLVWLWSDLGTESLLIRVTFIGLAALTVPHMILLGLANSKRNRRENQRLMSSQLQ